jgi:hypothetical protein
VGSPPAPGGHDSSRSTTPHRSHLLSRQPEHQTTSSPTLAHETRSTRDRDTAESFPQPQRGPPVSKDALLFPFPEGGSHRRAARALRSSAVELIASLPGCPRGPPASLSHPFRVQWGRPRRAPGGLVREGASTAYTSRHGISEQERDREQVQPAAEELLSSSSWARCMREAAADLGRAGPPPALQPQPLAQGISQRLSVPRRNSSTPPIGSARRVRQSFTTLQ